MLESYDGAAIEARRPEFDAIGRYRAVRSIHRAFAAIIEVRCVKEIRKSRISNSKAGCNLSFSADALFMNERHPRRLPSQNEGSYLSREITGFGACRIEPRPPSAAQDGVAFECVLSVIAPRKLSISKNNNR